MRIGNRLVVAWRDAQRRGCRNHAFLRAYHRLVTGVVGVSLSVLPKIADACPNCFATSGRKVLNTYYLTALMLGLLPMGMVGAFVGWFVRQSRRRNEP